MVKGSEVIAAGNCGLMPDANHIAIPEMFKAFARCFCFYKFTTKVFFDSDYEWEVFDISYEDGELIINSLYHDPDAEPYCEDCEDNYRSLHSYVCCVRGAGTFDHQGQSEVWHGECQREGPQDRQTADNEGRHPCHFLQTLSFFCLGPDECE